MSNFSTRNCATLCCAAHRSRVKNLTDKKASHTRAPRRLLDGLGLGNVSEKFQDTALELGGLEAEGGGVECAGDFPELFGAAGGGVDAPGVAAGERFVLFVTD